MGTYKSILFIFLSILIALPLVLPLVLQLNILLVKFEAKEKLETSYVQTILVKKSEVQWVEDGKEILIHNRLFDVKNFKLSNEEYTLTGLFDDDETALKNHIGNLCDLNSKHKLLASCFQLLSQVYYQQSNNAPVCVMAQLHGTYAKEINFHLKNIFIKIPSPPPQGLKRTT